MPILAIAHSKGGAGKTTTAFNLLCEMNPAITIDFDLHRGLSVINSLRDEPLNIVAMTDKNAMLKLVKEYDDRGELVIIDCGGFDSDLTRTAIAIADQIIVPAADTLTERIGLSVFDQTLDEISQATGRDIQANLVICKVHHAKKNFPKLDAVLERTKHIKRLNSIIAYRPAHHENHEFGRGVTELVATRHSEAGKEIQALAAEINELLKAA